MRKWFWIIFGSLLLFLLLALIGIDSRPLLLTICLGGGWFFYLKETLPKVHVNGAAIASGLICLIAVAVIGHNVCAWLFRNWAKSATSDDSRRNWRWGWTIRSLVLVVVLFAAGICTVGVVHQTGWMLTGEDSVFTRTPARRAKFVCQLRLKGVVEAIEAYTRDHDGNLPSKFEDLIINEYLNPAILACPGSEDEPVPGSTPQELADNLRKGHHCSYQYLGKGLHLSQLTRDTVLILEPSANHESDGAHIVFGDFRVEWVAAENLPKYNRPATAPTSRRVSP